MVKFSTMRNRPNIKEFIKSPLGTLYMELNEIGYPVSMIRHFDGEISLKYVKDYFEIVLKAYDWIGSRQDLDKLVIVVRPKELGEDYILRPFQVYHISTYSYAHAQNPPEEPQKLKFIRKIFQKLVGGSVDKKTQIIEAILGRNIMKPNRKTYFDEYNDKLVIVEPIITIDDVKNWNLNSTVP